MQWCVKTRNSRIILYIPLEIGYFRIIRVSISPNLARVARYIVKMTCSWSISTLYREDDLFLVDVNVRP